MTVISSEFTGFLFLPVRHIFSLFFLGVEQFPVLLQVPFVYSAVVFKVGIDIFLLLVCFCPINIWTQLFTLCCLHSFHLLSLA